jgi:hypothetical protein
VAPNVGHRDGGRHRDVERPDLAHLGDVDHRVGHGQQGGGDAVILVTHRQADVAVERGLEDRLRAGGQLKRHHPVPV